MKIISKTIKILQQTAKGLEIVGSQGGLLIESIALIKVIFLF
jgi:hypothetical protein